MQARDRPSHLGLCESRPFSGFSATQQTRFQMSGHSSYHRGVITLSRGRERVRNFATVVLKNTGWGKADTWALVG
jgi:hypothetical protein